MYEIVFRHRGEIVRVWTGYSSYREATTALNDADLMIPATWSSEIRVQEDK